MCVDVEAGVCRGMCVDVEAGVCRGMCVDLEAGVCRGMCVDLVAGVCRGMCRGMCVDLEAGVCGGEVVCWFSHGNIGESIVWNILYYFIQQYMHDYFHIISSSPNTCTHTLVKILP